MNLRRIIPLFSVILFAIFCRTSGSIFCESCDFLCRPGYKMIKGVCRKVYRPLAPGPKFQPPKGAVFSLYQSPCLEGYVRINRRCRKIRHLNQKFIPGSH